MPGLQKKIRTMISKACFALFLSAGVCLPLKATVIEMSMLIDGSGSVGSANFQTQMQAYQSVFSNSFYTNFLNPGDQLYVSAYQFATNVTLEQSTFLIDSDASATAFGTVLGNLVWDAGWTNTGAAIVEALNDLNGNSVNGDRRLIHMVTDGNPCLPDHMGGCPQSVAQYANTIFSEGIILSAIGVGQGLNPLYIEPVTTHLDLIDDFSDLGSTLVDVFERDLHTEASSVPEPSTLLLLLSAFALLNLRRRYSVF